jgi:hydrogenase maturation factor
VAIIGTGGISPCGENVCITCSDQAVPVRIIEFLADGLARVDTGISIENIQIELVDMSLGDKVLVHAGVAIAKVS